MAATSSDTEASIRTVTESQPKRHRQVWVHETGFYAGGSIDTDDWHRTEEQALECEKHD